MTDRWVMLGLAPPRATWFGAISRWATAGALPAEFVKCVSPEELRARLRTGRPFSAAVLDGGLPRVDRDLVADARRAGCAVMIVDDNSRRDWLALGANAVLPSQLTREQLVDALAAHANGVLRADPRPDEARLPPLHSPRATGEVVAVCGSGGTGVSTVAAALAQGLARRATGRSVVLADLARNAQQALLHDVGDVVPGIEELVELHRSRIPSVSEVRSLTFELPDRGYHLLLGLRRPARWAIVRPQAFVEALASLRTAFGLVVCDVTGDFEGERATGSADVEDRNCMGREAARVSDVVFAVGRPGIKGMHSLASVVRELLELGVPAGRVIPVVNAVPRSRRRATTAANVRATVVASANGADLAPPVVLPHRAVDAAIHDGVPLPAPLPNLLAEAYSAVRAIEGARESAREEAPELVVPGSLAAWSD
jgi:hypothetical protein